MIDLCLQVKSYRTDRQHLVSELKKAVGELEDGGRGELLAYESGETSRISVDQVR